MIRREFKMSVTDARGLSFVGELRTVGFALEDDEVMPFTIGWPDPFPTGSPASAVCGEATRFRLPGLLFEGRLVAQLGFRNKDGFMMVLPGLPAQVEQAAASRFRRMISLARMASRAHKEELRGLAVEATALLIKGEVAGNALAAWRPRTLESRENAHELVSAICERLSEHPRVRFALSHGDNENQGELMVSLVSATSPLSVEMLRVHWSPILHGGTVMAHNVKVILGPLMPKDRVTAFVQSCRAEAVATRQEAKERARRLEVEGQDRLMAAVAGTDFGYD